MGKRLQDEDMNPEKSKNRRTDERKTKKIPLFFKEM